MVLLYDDLVSRTSALFPCREHQIQQVASLLAALTPAPPNIVLHGLEATAKTSILTNVLDTSSIPHAIVRSLECITPRQFFERTIALCLEAVNPFLRQDGNSKQYPRCESTAVFASHLQVLLEGLEKFVLVVDDLNHQKETILTFIPALARLAETIPCLTVVLIFTFPHPRILRVTGAAHVYFPSYNREEVLRILSKEPPPIFDFSLPAATNYSEEDAAEDNAWLWHRYCGALWDSLGKAASRNIVAFRQLADKLWIPFISSIRDGTFGTRDFSRLMVAKRSLFQTEEFLVEQIVPSHLMKKQKSQLEGVSDLPFYTKYLICAAYLASYNPTRLDPVFFMKSSEKKRKRGGGVQGRSVKHRKVSRRLLSPSSFTLERLLAILHAIVPHTIVRSSDIHTQIASLLSLGLLIHSRGVGSRTVLESTSKWNVDLSYDFVAAVARDVGFEIADWTME